MSAIPWIGQDIVESNNITVIFILFIFLFSLNKDILPTVGIINNNALKKVINL